MPRLPDITINPTDLRATHVLAEQRRRERYSGVDYNPPTRSYAIWLHGRIVAWAVNEREAEIWLRELARQAVASS